MKNAKLTTVLLVGPTSHRNLLVNIRDGTEYFFEFDNPIKFDLQFNSVVRWDSNCNYQCIARMVSYCLENLIIGSVQQ